MDHSMLAGVAAAEITPQPGLQLQGHWNTGRSHTVLYPLEVRALVLRSNHRTACLITLDTIGITRETTARIREQIQHRCGIAPDHIMICASHTHCAPATMHSLGMLPDPHFMQKLEHQTVACAAEAAGSLQPVMLGLGSGAAHFNVNRRPIPGSSAMAVNWAGVVDHRVRLLRLDTHEERALAILFCFSCHPTTKVGSEGFISPDYPGVARAQIEAELGCRALFIPGCFGNVRPQINGTFASATREQLDAAAHQLARAVCFAAQWTSTRPHDLLDACQQEIEFPFAPTKSLEDLHKMAEATTPASAPAISGPWARRLIEKIQRSAVPAGEASFMQKFRIGPLVLIAIPGEPVQEIGYAVERKAAELGVNVDVWAIGYTNDMLGYLVTERQKAEGGYEPGAYSYYDRPAGFKEEEQLIVETAGRLLQTVR